MLKLNEKISQLNRIGIALTSANNLEDLFELIVKTCREFTNADAGSLFTLDNGKLIFRIAQTESLEKKAGKKTAFKAFPIPLSSKSVAGYVALTGKVINVEDCYLLDPEKGPVVDLSYDKRIGYRSKSMLAVPMHDAKGEILGVIQLINAMNTKGNIIRFPDDSVEMIISIASQAAVSLRNARMISEMRDLFASFVKYSATAIEERSPHTAGHTRRVAGLCMRFTEAINNEKDGYFADKHLTDSEVEEFWFAAWLHDIGKIAVKEKILEKSTRLTDERLNWIITRLHYITLARKLETLDDKEKNSSMKNEKLNQEIDQINSDIIFLKELNNSGFLTDDAKKRLDSIVSRTYRDYDGTDKPFLDPYEVENLSVKKGNFTEENWVEMHSHVIKSEHIIDKIPFPKNLHNVVNIAKQHHERLNGSGYPEGLTADQISLQARILAVADVFDALVAQDRPYKKAIPLEKAIAILQNEADKDLLDDKIVNFMITKELYRNHNDDQAEYPWKLETF